MATGKEATTRSSLRPRSQRPQQEMSERSDKALWSVAYERPAACLPQRRAETDVEVADMGLVSIPLPEAAALLAQYPMPPEVETLILEGERRIEAFLERTRDARMLSFVPSEFRPTWRGLAWLHDQQLVGGRSFCEWGSGFGVVALLAAQLGFHASGIEVEPVLVEEAEALATAVGVEAEFALGSFVPDGSLETPGAIEELDWLDYSAPPAYEDLGYDADEFDVVFAYPWPGEKHVIYDLFEEHGSPGAVLLTFHGADGLLLHRLERSRQRD